MSTLPRREIVKLSGGIERRVRTISFVALLLLFLSASASASSEQREAIDRFLAAWKTETDLTGILAEDFRWSWSDGDAGSASEMATLLNRIRGYYKHLDITVEEAVFDGTTAALRLSFRGIQGSIGTSEYDNVIDIPVVLMMLHFRGPLLAQGWAAHDTYGVANQQGFTLCPISEIESLQ